MLAGILTAVTAAAPAHAAGAEPAPADGKTGPSEYEAGLTAYNLAHFDEAARHFENAYQVDHAPILLFNIAQCHRKSGDPEKAIFFYRRYLDEDPGTAKRAEVEARIADLRARVAAAQSKEARPAPTETPVAADAPATVPAPPAPQLPALTMAPPASPTGAARPPAQPSPASPVAAPPATTEAAPRRRVLPWATLATSTLVLAFGVYETTRWIGAASDFDGLRDPATNKGLCGASDAGYGADARCASLYHDMTTARALSFGGLGAAAALGVVSAILFHRDTAPGAQTAHGGGVGFAAQEVSCGPSGAQVGLACAARF